MGYVDDAFAKLKSNLEITRTEQKLASRRQNEIRDHLCGHLDIDRTFLTGSYARQTKTKKLKDVDIFCVLKGDGADAHLRDGSPGDALLRLQTELAKEYTHPVPSIGRRSCTVEFASTDEVPSYDVVLAFDRGGGGYEIPDRIDGGWIASDPGVHKQKATDKNAACGDKWIPLVKMVKGFNREWDKPVRPSFLLEVMALDLIRPPFGRYQDEIVLFLANAAERLEEEWPDPAGLGPDVNSSMSAAEKRAASERLREALAVAERAVQLEDDGIERAAVDAWRELFGSRMPKP
ncbi:MAG TPA: CBASS oligonucleotide cyclase [Solirubrobacteraceae bacterium]|jgi:predicted nucleotidyltransferase